MAAKSKKKPTVKAAAKKAPATLLNSVPAGNVTAFKGFSQFPQFKPFTMETPTMMKGNKQAEKMAQDAIAMSQEKMDAMMKSSTIFAKGLEDIIKTCMDIAQTSGEKNANMGKTLMACKTLNELTEVQSRMAQASFDDFMTNATKISEMSVKLCTDCFEPLNDQMSKSIKRASSMAA